MKTSLNVSQGEPNTAITYVLQATVYRVFKQRFFMTSFWKSFDDLFTKVHYVQGPSWQTVSFEFLEDGFEILRNFASTFS